MVIEDPSQSSELWGLEESRALEIVTKVSAIEESIAKIRGVINGKRMSTTEAIAPAINELIKALAPRPEPTAKMKITPKFERQSLPDFTSGKFRDYPMWKKDRLELVSDQ